MKYTILVAVDVEAEDYEQAAKKGFAKVGKVFTSKKPLKIHLVRHDGNGASALLDTIMETSVTASASISIS